MCNHLLALKKNLIILKMNKQISLINYRLKLLLKIKKQKMIQ